MAEELSENLGSRQLVAEWVKKVTPTIERALIDNKEKAKNPLGDPYSMNLCGEVGGAIPQKELDLIGIEGDKFFGVEANNHSAIHVGYYVPEQDLVIDAVSGQWGDSEGNELTDLIRKHPEIFVGRILVATPKEIKEKLGWEYKVLK